MFGNLVGEVGELSSKVNKLQKLASRKERGKIAGEGDNR